MKKILFIIALISFSATPLNNKSFHRMMIVWNVGQGQWVTSVEETMCRHFDVGGEFFPWKKLKSLCASREQRLTLSHWDWDHIGALARWPVAWKTCLELRPLGKSSKRKMSLLEKISTCPGKVTYPTWSPKFAKDTNSASQVIEYQNFLIPGDSPTQEEQTWKNNPWVPESRVLILGHHGSRTSTSQELLNRLPKVRMAIASARWARYKHPHAEVVSLLRKNHIALLRTEDWGNIWFEQ